MRQSVMKDPSCFETYLTFSFTFTVSIGSTLKVASDKVHRKVDYFQV